MTKQNQFKRERDGLPPEKLINPVVAEWLAVVLVSAVIAIVLFGFNGGVVQASGTLFGVKFSALGGIGAYAVVILLGLLVLSFVKRGQGTTHAQALIHDL